LEKGKGKRKETAKMGSGNESGGREESTNGKKSGLIKEGQPLEWKRSAKERPSSQNNGQKQCQKHARSSIRKF